MQRQKVYCVKLLGHSLITNAFNQQIAGLQVRTAVLNRYTGSWHTRHSALELGQQAKGVVRSTLDLCCTVSPNQNVTPTKASFPV